jgi:PBSX family phage portal protein
MAEPAPLIEDEEFAVYEIEALGLSPQDDRPDAIVMPDQFNITGDDLKKVRGVTTAAKRRIGRQLEKRFVGEGDAKSKQALDPSFSAYNVFDVVLPPYNMNYLAKLYEKNAHNNAAINAKVYNIVALGYDFEPTTEMLNRIDAAEGNDKALSRLRRNLEKTKAGLGDWIESLNEEDSFTETLIKVWKDFESTGNGYIEVGRTASGDIGYLGHIPSTTVRIRRERDGFVQMVDNIAIFFKNFGDKEQSNPFGTDPNPNELIAVRNYTPNNTYYGVPDYISSLVALAGNEFSGQYNLDYFEHHAVPRHVVIVKGAMLSARAEAQLYEFFQSSLKGKSHRTLYIPIKADDPERKIDVEFKAVEANTQEASFIGYKDSNRDEILSAHRTPITKVSIAPGIPLAAARDADKTFKEQVTRPLQRILERKLNMIVKEKTDALSLRLNELALTDEDTQSKIDERYLRMQVFTPNEVRIQKGLPPRDGGDEVVQLTGQQAADQNATGRQSRTRDAARSAGATDSAGEGRNAQGAGRTTP